MIGQTLSHYRITAKLGEGGMGEVYRATDTKLDREVAIKVLPRAFTEDAERLARFEREAKLLAQLHHPHIASIFGLEETDGIRALVMELVEGPTLAERLAAGPLPLEETLSIVRQIAEALEEAHDKGIIHRDLKPQNVKAPAEGKVKVLDFGLAKAMTTGGAAHTSASVLARSPTMTAGATELGMILGTAAYMAPEQAKGLAVDKRADIWAFGVLLHEMLSGQSLFAGETVTDTLAGVLKNEIDFGTLPDTTPAALRGLLRRCLARNPKNRLHDIADARIVLDEIIAGGALEPPPGPAALAPQRSRRWWLATAAGALVLLAAGAGIGRFLAPSTGGGSAPPTAALTALSVPLPAGFVLVSDEAPVLDLSRDGRLIVFEASGPQGRLLFRRRLDRVGVEPITGTEGAVHPFLSPDGRSVGFFAGTRMLKVPLEGGVPVPLAAVGAYRGATWTEEGWIVFTTSYGSGLFKVREGGGAPVALTQLDVGANERSHRWPSAVPGTPWILFTVGVSNRPSFYDDARIDAVRLDTGERKTVFEGAWMARFAPPATLLLQRRTALLAAAFDPARAQVTGRERLTLEGVGGESSSGAGYFAAGEGGTLAYVPAMALSADKTVVLVSRDGAGAGGARVLPMPEKNYWYPRYSPDGRTLSLTIGSGTGTDEDIWLYDVRDERLSRLTFKPASLSQVWSPDGHWLAYGVTGERKAAIFRKRVDGVGNEEQIGGAPEDMALPTDWHPGGAVLASLSAEGEINSTLIPLGKGEPLPFADTPGGQWGVDFSPDGRFAAYTSTESGVDEIVVTTYPEGGGKWQVSVDGGQQPVWSRDGQHLFFVQGDAIWRVEVKTGAGFRAGTPQQYLRGPYLLRTSPLRNFDVGPNDQLALVRQRTDVVAPKQLEVLVGWQAKRDEP